MYWFCVMLLCWKGLSELTVSYLGALGSFKHKVILFVDRNNFTYSYLRCLNVEAKTWSITLNKSGKNGRLCLIPNFFEGVYYKGMLFLSLFFLFCSSWDDVIFSPFVIWVCLCVVTHSLIGICWTILASLKTKSTWSWCIIFQKHFWILFANILLKNFLCLLSL